MDNSIRYHRGYSEKFHSDERAALVETRAEVAEQESMYKDDLNDIIRLNIAGTLFQTFRQTLKTFPETLLADLHPGMPQYLQATGEFFFDRNPALFVYILDAYRTGTVHVPKDVCATNFREELHFWGLNPAHVAPCCWKAFYKCVRDTSALQRLMHHYRDRRNTLLKLQERSTLRTKIWLVLDEPKSSTPAMVWCVFMALISVTSLFPPSLANMDTFAQTKTSDEYQRFVANIARLTQWRNTTLTLLVSKHPVLLPIEAICFACFTIEAVVSFIVAPNRREFFKSLVRILETVCWLSYWITLIIRTCLVSEESIYLIVTFLALTYFTFFRIVRLMRAVDHITSFHIMRLAFIASTKELSAIGIILFCMCVVFGNVMFITETLYNDTFANPFLGMYWALITLTTVGYGDYAPSSPTGHLIAIICAMVGIVVLALPIGIIASTYSRLYNQHQYAKKHVTESNTFVIRVAK